MHVTKTRKPKPSFGMYGGLFPFSSIFFKLLRRLNLGSVQNVWIVRERGVIVNLILCIINRLEKHKIPHESNIN